MVPTKQEVATHIREAFRGVTLGTGVGLLAGQGLDDYADEATRIAYREQDEKNDWEAIPVEALNRCYSSLSFFDAEGMRFHLPAFLVAELRGILDHDLIFQLTHFEHLGTSRFELLNGAQRNAVRQFLRLRIDDELFRSDIEHALTDY